MRVGVHRQSVRVFCKERTTVQRKPQRQFMIPAQQIPSVTSTAKSWAYLNGLIMRNAENSGVIHAPVALTPCPFPKSSFEKAVEIMPLMNELYHAVSSDYQFLMNTLQPTAEFDEFTANLLKIYSEAHELQNGSTALELGIHRSDYMLDKSSGRLLQIELNTIASSFGALSCQVSKMHDFLFSQNSNLDRARIVVNNAIDEISGALAQAHQVQDLPDSQILMIADHNDGNLYDQQFVTMELWKQYKIQMIRRSLSEIMDCGRVDENGDLLIDGARISVVYFRSAYSPTSYPTQQEWEGRRLIEISSACKCPSINYHLTGTKKIQQELAKPGNVEKFLSVEDSNKVREFFAGLWGFDNLEDQRIKDVMNQATLNPEAFVLKPQREGGGNNLYGQQMMERLSGKQGLAAYILMQRIRPQIHKSILLRNEESFEEDTVSELGIYGVHLSKGKKVLLNKSAGHLLRTKLANSDEGGVATGYAVLDSPYLIDE